MEDSSRIFNFYFGILTGYSTFCQEPLDPSHEFWIFEAHSQNDDLCLSRSPSNNVKVDFNVGSHTGITIRKDENQTSPLVYLSSPVKQVPTS
jgi:hypothetical protein